MLWWQSLGGSTALAGSFPSGELSPGVLDFTPSASRKVEAEEGALSDLCVTSQSGQELPVVSPPMFAYFHWLLAAPSSLGRLPSWGPFRC